MIKPARFSFMLLASPTSSSPGSLSFWADSSCGCRHLGSLFWAGSLLWGSRTVFWACSHPGIFRHSERKCDERSGAAKASKSKQKQHRVRQRTREQHTLAEATRRGSRTARRGSGRRAHGLRLRLLPFFLLFLPVEWRTDPESAQNHHKRGSPQHSPFLPFPRPSGSGSGGGLSAR